MALVFDRGRGEQAGQFIGREWLDTNGIRGYACGTVPDIPTRKYHGLFVVDVPESGGRHVLLSSLQASVEIGGHEFDLSSFQYPGVVHPDGIDNLEQFEFGMHPTWRWRCGSAIIERELMMLRGENTILVRYKLIAGAPVRLHLNPLLAFRPHHELTRCNAELNRGLTSISGATVTTKPYTSLPELTMSIDSADGSFDAGAFWNYNLEYDIERRRGFSYSEDLFCPGQFSCQLRSNHAVIFRASLDSRKEKGQSAGEWQVEEKRRKSIAAPFYKKFPKNEALALLHARAGETLVTNEMNHR